MSVPAVPSSVWALAFLAALGAAGSSGCAPIEIQYDAALGGPGVEAALDRRPIAPSHVAVFDRNSAPWEYVKIGDLVEVHRGSIPGGRPARQLVLREAAGQHGCEGLMLKGNVSRFEGAYRYRPRGGRSSDRSRRGGRWEPVFDLKGEGAECVVRVGGPPLEEYGERPQNTGVWSFVPTEYPLLRSEHY